MVLKSEISMGHARVLSKLDDNEDISSHSEILDNKNEILIQKNNALDKKLSDSYQYVENLKNEINLLHNSTSWKITKPLRKFKLVIKKIIN